MKQVELGIVLTEQIIVGHVIPDQVIPAQQVEMAREDIASAASRIPLSLNGRSASWMVRSSQLDLA